MIEEIFYGVGVISFFFFIATWYWMFIMRKYTKENRIINSMTLKTILEYYEGKGAKIDIGKIQSDVENNR